MWFDEPTEGELHVRSLSEPDPFPVELQVSCSKDVAKVLIPSQRLLLGHTVQSAQPKDQIAPLFHLRKADRATHPALESRVRRLIWLLSIFWVSSLPSNARALSHHPLRPQQRVDEMIKTSKIDAAIPKAIGMRDAEARQGIESRCTNLATCGSRLGVNSIQSEVVVI